jgi:hypothetical protein
MGLQLLVYQIQRLSPYRRHELSSEKALSVSYSHSNLRITGHTVSQAALEHAQLLHCLAGVLRGGCLGGQAVVRTCPHAERGLPDDVLALHHHLCPGKCHGKLMRSRILLQLWDCSNQAAPGCREGSSKVHLVEA